MTSEKYDTIIIGSGISGMTAGIILAKEGEHVLIAEQHAHPGGLTQVYQRAGLTFPTGVHRLGALKTGQPLWYYFNYLGLTGRLSMSSLSEEGFESYHFPDGCFSVPQGHGAYKAKLIRTFPSKAAAIENYFTDMAACVSGIALYNPGITGASPLSSRYTRSVDDYFSDLGINGKLKSILFANNPLFGLSSRECPVMTHFIISDAYLNSSFRLNETNAPFAEALGQSFRSLGGTIKTGSKIDRLLTRDRAVTGVRLSSGKKITAQKIIYSGHPSRLLDLCPPKSFRPVFEKRLKNAENTPGLFGVAMKWEKKNCPVADNDAYIYDNRDVNAHYAGGENQMIFLSALPSGEDATHLAVTALATLSDEDRSRLAAGYNIPGKKIYREIKTGLAEKVMTRIEATFPGAGKQVEIVDTYSPDTFERYTLTPGGTAYGIKKTAQAFMQGIFSPATRLKNLFLTGQSIGFSGIHGAISASVNLCTYFYPEGYLMDKIRKEESL
ncbi:MAG: NAD(P)/FAD-dependent oxidoreductase [Desulfobacterales bacterium]|nr:NAD(P)/FAD-dependent oxidoreductase [Desulfobacterales bacterium]